MDEKNIFIRVPLEVREELKRRKITKYDTYGEVIQRLLKCTMDMQEK